MRRPATNRYASTSAGCNLQHRRIFKSYLQTMLRQKYKRRAAYRPTTSSYHPTKKTVLLTENHYSAEKNCLLFNHRTCIMSSEISVQIPPDINKAGSNSSSIYSQQCLLQSKFLATRCCAVNMASRKAGRPTPLILRLLKIPYKNT